MSIFRSGGRAGKFLIVGGVVVLAVGAWLISMGGLGRNLKTQVTNSGSNYGNSCSAATVRAGSTLLVEDIITSPIYRIDAKEMKSIYKGLMTPSIFNDEAQYSRLKSRYDRLLEEQEDKARQYILDSVLNTQRVKSTFDFLREDLSAQCTEKPFPEFACVLGFFEAKDNCELMVGRMNAGINLYYDYGNNQEKGQQPLIEGVKAEVLTGRGVRLELSCAATCEIVDQPTFDPTSESTSEPVLEPAPASSESPSEPPFPGGGFY